MTDAASNAAESGDDAAPRISLGKGRALVPVLQAATKGGFAAGLGRSHVVVAAGVAVVMGAALVGGTAVFASKSQPVTVAQAAPPADTTMDVLYRVQGEVRSLKASLDGLRATAEDGRQAETIRGLKKSVDVLKQDLEGVKTASAGAVAQLGAKLDKLDRDPGPKLNEIAARLDRLDHDPSPKLAEIAARLDKMDHESEAKIAQVAAQATARLDRVERQVASTETTGSIPPVTAAAAPPKAPPPPQATAVLQPRAPLPPQRAAQPAPVVASPTGPSATLAAALPPARPETTRTEPAKSDSGKPDVPKPELAKADVAPQPRPQDAAPKPATLDGWLLRDVYGGVALVEGRAGGLREVAPGEFVPGVGEIRSIERRGRGWVVVTSRGLIQADNRW